MKIRIYKILKKTNVEGPHTRYCIWVQGCSKHCKGCLAKETWNFNAGKEYDVEELLEDILNTKGIDGVTFLGGEPFEQVQALEFLCKNIKKSDLSIVCFTGNKYEDIKQKYESVLSNIDLLIDGEFDEKQKDFSRPWVGSKNQNYYFLTERFSKNILKEYKNKVEINIQKNGILFINGMGDFEKLQEQLNILKS